MARLRQLDTIYLRDLCFSAVVGPDAWNRPDKAQPITLSLQLQLDTSDASTSDELAHTFSYGHICKDISTKLDGETFSSLNQLAVGVADLANNWPGEVLSVQAWAPKGLLRVEGGLGREVLLRRVEIIDTGFRHLQWRVDTLGWLIKGLKLACIIGVNPHERLEKQNISIDLKLPEEMVRPDTNFYTGGAFSNWRDVVQRVCEVVEASSFKTLEALAGLISQTCLTEFPIHQITVSVEKPSALTFVAGAGVEISRGRDSIPTSTAFDVAPSMGGKKPEKRKAPGIHTEEWLLKA